MTFALPVVASAAGGYLASRFANRGQTRAQAGGGGGFFPQGAAAGGTPEGNARKGLSTGAGLLQGYGTNWLNQGQNLFGQAAGPYGQALSFYRRAMTNPGAALAGTTESLAAGGRGLERGIAASTPRGGVRDQQIAEARRATYSQIAGVRRDAPFQAAQGLAAVAGQGLQAGVGAAGLGANTLQSSFSGFAPLLNYGLQNQQMDQAQRLAIGEGVGSLLYQVIRSKRGGGGH